MWPAFATKCVEFAPVTLRFVNLSRPCYHVNRDSRPRESILPNNSPISPVGRNQRLAYDRVLCLNHARSVRSRTSPPRLLANPDNAASASEP